MSSFICEYRQNGESNMSQNPAPHHRPKNRNNDNDTASREFDHIPFLETEEGLAYIAAIRAILEKARKPLCTRDIHTKLKDAALPQHTLDALYEIGADRKLVGSVMRYSVPVEGTRIVQDITVLARHDVQPGSNRHRAVEPSYLFVGNKEKVRVPTPY